MSIPVLKISEASVATLNDLVPGERARVLEVMGDDSITVRLMEMGLTDGEDVELLGRAPLGDPIEYCVRGYRLSLRSDEAKRVEVLRLDDAPVG